MEFTIKGIRHTKRIGLIARFRQRVELRRQRRWLLDLDEHLLNDIGLTDQQARGEAERPLWDVPRTWRR